MARARVESWGRLTRAEHDVSRAAEIADVQRLLREPGPILASGMQRSYGDVALNAGNRLLDMRGLDRFIAADWSTGVVTVQAGMTLDALLQVSVPRGWFIPVTPGTKFVTIGGMIANDVHGKNHPSAGSFGRHVRAFTLIRSDRGAVACSEAAEPDLFRATIGGLGLTGVIATATISLARIPSDSLDVEGVRFGHVDDYFRLVSESRDWSYVVAWVDCMSSGAELGRGLFSRARWSPGSALTPHRAPGLSVPVDFPSGTLNRFSISAFNAAYRHRPGAVGASRQHYSTFFHPLDGVGRWNRMYGPRGFFQHQSVIPPEAAQQTIRAMLEITARERLGSFLVVIKEFGDLPSPGLLSFPRAGTTFALDFPNGGPHVQRVLQRFADMAIDAGGRLYPAKDALMTPAHFNASFPDWGRLEALRDPSILSDFWRRVTKVAA
jgi:L-gulonolactone oxidase